MTQVGPDCGGVGAVGRRHILTVSVEEYFHGGALSRVVRQEHWDRLESRIDRSVDEVLAFLQQHGARATFFVLGVVAERNPALVRRIVAAGHEVASRGHWPRAVSSLSADQLADELDRAKAAIEAAGGREVLGFRAPRWLRPADLWVLELLADKGYRYDASINPTSRALLRASGGGRVARLSLPGGGGIWEVPVSTDALLGVRYSVGGGNWWRQLPRWLIRRGLDRWLEGAAAPLVVYFMPWELDAAQPQVTAVAPLDRVRHYRNLGRTGEYLQRCLAGRQFVSVAEWLGLAPGVVTGDAAAPRGGPGPAVAATASVTDVSVVVPLFNERDNIAPLLRTMDSVAERLAQRYRLELVLVDDGSGDDSWQVLQRLTAGRPRTRLLRHDRNRGIAAAIATGLQAATAEWAVTVDCDCSYDPHAIGDLLPLLVDADLVTASPYHPDGGVRNVPRWRLGLSRTLSWLYRCVVGVPLHTWTSCFRAYRRQAVIGVTVQDGGFLGVAELLIRVIRRGGRVVEVPAVLEARLLGTSKMKVLRTIVGHLGLLWRTWRGRVV